MTMLGAPGSVLGDRGRICAGGGGREFTRAPRPHWLRAVEAGVDPRSVWMVWPPHLPLGHE